MTFKGVGTHGAKPHLGKDPITASGHFLSALQSIVGRVVNPLQPAVVSACSVQAGDPRALNVIPDIVEIGERRGPIPPRCATSWRRRSSGCAWRRGHVRDRGVVRVPPAHSAGHRPSGCDRPRAEGGAGRVRKKVVTDFEPSTGGRRFRLLRRGAPAPMSGSGTARPSTARSITTRPTTSTTRRSQPASPSGVALVEQELRA